MSNYPDSPGQWGVETSIVAGDTIATKLRRLQRLAQAAIRDAGAHGLTADEHSERLDMDRCSVQPSTTELKRNGLISDSDQRRPNAIGNLAIVWNAV